MANSYSIKQFRYYGDSNTDQNSAGVTASALGTGALFSYPIIKLGIQTLPGIKFHLTENAADPIIIGSSGIYELDLTNSTAQIGHLDFDQASLRIIERADGGYLIIDTMYENTL